LVGDAEEQGIGGSISPLFLQKGAMGGEGAFHNNIISGESRMKKVGGHCGPGKK